MNIVMKSGKATFFILKKLADAVIVKGAKALTYPLKPRYLNFPVTYKCNSRCIMCGIWQRGSDEKELSIDEIKNFFERNREFLSKLVSIGITGGEPFLRKDIVEIVKIARTIFPKTLVGVQTNGLLTDLIREKAGEIKAFYDNFGMAISLDGVGAVHDLVRGVDGAFQKSTATIKALQDLGIKRITCGMTITTQNYRYIKQVSEKVRELGCEFSCFPIDLSGFYNNRAITKEVYSFSDEIKDQIIRSLDDFRYHYYTDNLRQMLMDNKARSLPCYSGYTSLVLDAYGYVKPCILLDEVFGNIRSGKSLKDILYGEKSKQIRNKVSKCSCWNQCEVSTSAEVEVFDVLRWFLRAGNKKAILKDILEKKIS